MNKNKKSAFTLVEILVVVALIAVLATITFVAINPAQNFLEARDAERAQEVQAIVGGLGRYLATQGNSIDDFVNLATCGGDPAVSIIGDDATGDPGEYIDLQFYGVLPVMPKDPQGGTDTNTGYTLCKTAENNLVVSAPNAEGDPISQTI